MKRTFLGALLLYLSCIILPAKATIIESGTCGDNLTWTFTNDGTLTISGTGEMNNYDYLEDDNYSPWASHANNIKTARIEQGVTSIGDGAFAYCPNLTSITIPESVTSIGKEAFRRCHFLNPITIPESVTSIGDGAFWSCSSLTYITIPESVTNIGDEAFNSCSSLNSITIPESVTSIKKETFHNCYSLKSITIPKSVTNIGDGAFDGCSNLKSIVIPESITSIGERAFAYCNGLNSITIPKSVTSIGDYAFNSCSGLTSITIQEGVTSIGNGAFARCSSLTQMTVLATTPPTVGISAFYNVSRDIPVYVPEESLTAYQNADVWKEFNLQALSSTGLHTPVLPKSIRVYDGLLHNPQGLPVSFYDMQGCQVYSGKDTILRMPAGVYVLQCGKASGKVMFP